MNAAREFSDNEVTVLAQVERRMDDGTQPFVFCPKGLRWAFPVEIMVPLRVVSGQRVTSTILDQLLQRNVARLAASVAIDKANHN
jgi:hypothetical protein